MTTEIQQCQQAMLLVDSLIAVNDQIKANNALKEKDYKNTLEVKDKVINEAVDRIYYYKDRNAKLERNMKIGFVGLGALVILFAIL